MTALILASSSKIRHAMLKSAGLQFAVQPADLDETALIAAGDGETAAATALRLAAAKALAASIGQPGALIIGADQVLICDGRLYQKAADMAEARQNLRLLSGRKHQLISAVCVAEGDKVIWQHHDVATLTVKTLGDAFIDCYLEAAAAAVLQTVGGYELEGQGAWLFDRIEGDYFTILGLPLLPLLGFLGTRGFGPA